MVRGMLIITLFSMYAYINPVIAVVLGWLILDERFDWVMVTSTAVILFGVVLLKTAAAVQPKPEAENNEPLNSELLKGCKQVAKIKELQLDFQGHHRALASGGKLAGHGVDVYLYP